MTRRSIAIEHSGEEHKIVHCPKCHTKMISDGCGGWGCPNPDCCYDGMLAQNQDVCPRHKQPEPCWMCQEEFENSLELSDLAYGKGW